MKKLLLIVLLGVSSLLTLAPLRASANISERHILGTEVPFPLGTEVPFPWEKIEGIWEVNDPTMAAYFSFQVQRNDRGLNVLKVLHIDHQTKRVIGQGAGFANVDQKTVRAVMRGSQGAYLIFVRVFRDAPPYRRGDSHTATVLTIRDFGQGAPQELHFILRKISSNPFRGR